MSNDFNRALALKAEGKLAEATDVLVSLKATEFRTLALSQLVQTDPGSLTEAEINELRLDATPASQFAAGHALERLGDYDGAWGAFSAGNRLRHDPEKARAAAQLHADRIAYHKAIFGPALFQKLEGWGHETTAPIFVVGLPRSGSTLIERILSAHPSVEALGEIDALPKAINGRWPYVQADEIAGDHFVQIAEDYLARAGSGARRFVDKQLPNAMGVGLIHIAMPGASVVHSAKHPLDQFVSLYSAYIGQPGDWEWAYSASDIVQRQIQHAELMAHWNDVLPGKVIELSNEALVADPEAQSRSLIKAVGLKWSAACLRPEVNPAPVNTRSAAQVRQPINDESVGRWRHYEKRLGKVIEALSTPHS